MKMVTALLILVLAMATAAGAQMVVDYGWEDAGTILGQYPADSIMATNVAGYDGNPVHAGNFSLKLERLGTSTPQGFVAFLWNLQDGDEVTFSCWRYDGASNMPYFRLWSHYNNELGEAADARGRAE